MVIKHYFHLLSAWLTQVYVENAIEMVRLLCAGNFVFLFIAIARVRCQKVQCCLFEWTAIDHVTLNGVVQNCLFPEIDSIYRLTAQHDGVNSLAVHTKSIEPEHMQVSNLDYRLLIVMGMKDLK